MSTGTLTWWWSRSSSLEELMGLFPSLQSFPASPAAVGRLDAAILSLAVMPAPSRAAPQGPNSEVALFTPWRVWIQSGFWQALGSVSPGCSWPRRMLKALFFSWGCNFFA